LLLLCTRLSRCFSYKAAAGVDAELKDVLAGRKVDVYFDNVGGETLEAVLRRINIGARIVLCGAISRYNNVKDSGLDADRHNAIGARNYSQLITRRASMRGFIVLDYENRYGAARRELARWLLEGRIVARETRVRGLEQAPHALRGLFHGENLGKVVVEVMSTGEGEDAVSNPDTRRSRL
jgi:NADPH-dependent curcumin reductase CurA